MEVPFHVPADLFTAFLVGEVLVERVRVGALYRDLREELEANVSLGAEFFDLKVRSWLLLAKVVGGKGQNFEALIFVLFVERLETRVLFIREASFARDVDE